MRVKEAIEVYLEAKSNDARVSLRVPDAGGI